MCTLAAEETSSWLMIDPWEAFQIYQRTAVVLDHFDFEINTILGGVQTQDGEHRDVRVMLLAGSDLISTMSEPGVWAVEDVCISPSKHLRSGFSRKPLTYSWITFWASMARSSSSGRVRAWIKLRITWRVGGATSILSLSSSRTTSHRQKSACSFAEGFPCDTCSRLPWSIT